jgi:hydrogenase-4 component B
VLVLGALGFALLVRSRSRLRTAAQTVTWDCGYARPGSTMAYTASSFAQILVGLFSWLLRPRSQGAVPSEPFPPAGSFHTHVPEQVMEGILAPLWAGFRRTLIPLRAVQQGRIQQYLMYVLLTVCVLLASLYPLGEILLRWLGW